MFYSTNNHKTFSFSLIALTTKLSSKNGLTIYMTTSYGLSQKSSSCQNLFNMDITNSTNQLDFASNNSSIKTNIIITISNTNISQILYLLRKMTFLLLAKLPRSIQLVNWILNIKGFYKTTQQKKCGQYILCTYLHTSPISMREGLFRKVQGLLLYITFV